MSFGIIQDKVVREETKRRKQKGKRYETKMKGRS